MELLIVIGLLGALATLVMSELSMTREESLNDALVEKELSDIQAAFQRYVADCCPGQNEYEKFAMYGLAPLVRNDSATPDPWYQEEWDSARGKGWRGPYVAYEAAVEVDTTDSNASGLPDAFGQRPDSGGTEILVIETPYTNDDDGQNGDYYRVIPERDGTEVTQLWLVFPSTSGAFPSISESIGAAALEDQLDALPHKRRLLLGN